jgi:hypothetical protein
MLPRRVPETYRQTCREYRTNDNSLDRLRLAAQRQGWSFYYPFEEFHAARYEGNFYPKENFHWAGKSIHLFMPGLMAALAITPADAYFAEPEAKETKAELSRVLGVRLTAEIRDQDFAEFETTERFQEPGFVRQWYSRAMDFREVTTERAMTPRTALLISNSFGVFAVKFLAPAYSMIVHVNTNDLLPTEGPAFFEGILERVSPDDVIFMFHDEGVAAAGERIHGYLFAQP